MLHDLQRIPLSVYLLASPVWDLAIQRDLAILGAMIACVDRGVDRSLDFTFSGGELCNRLYCRVDSC